MIKKFTTLAFAVVALTSATSAQNPEIIFTSTPWATMGISGNGRYIVGTRQYTEAYRFDLDEERLIVQQAESEYSDMCFADVSDSGLIVGKSDSNMPALFHVDTMEWEELEVPYSEISEGHANEITPDGKTIVGYIMGTIDPTKPYTVFPCIWRLQSDGSYAYEELPNPETDFFGTKTQFVSTRTISADGNTVVGVMVEKRGRYYQPIVYKYDGTEWSYELPFYDLTFKGNTNDYERWNQLEPIASEYITAEPGTDEYNDQIQDFQEAQAQWQYNFWTSFRTGFEVTSVPVIMSTNGQWLAPMATETVWAWKEGDTTVTEESVISYPILFNLETNELVKFDKIAGGFYTYGISNCGDMISCDGFEFFIKPADSDEKIELSDYLKREYNFDIYSELPENTRYIDCCTISPDSQVIVGQYRSVTDAGELETKEVFIVKLPGYTSIMQTLNTPTNASIKLIGDELCFSANASNVKVYDMGGKLIMDCNPDNNKINVADFYKGVYVVNATIDGQVITGKVFKY